MDSKTPPRHWAEDTSEQFLDYGKYFIPAREQQMQLIVDILKDIPQPANVLELCCGEGLLAELILRAYPEVYYSGLDGSPLMLEKAAQRLSAFSNRVQLSGFELAERSWRKRDHPVQAVLSSLAIHHLPGEGKRMLFRDVCNLLQIGGVFIVADMVEPVSLPGKRVAAEAWDTVVRERSLKLDGNTGGLDFFSREHWNTFRYPDPDDIDHPSPLYDQLKWLEQAGFRDIDVHFMQAGHALFSGWKLAG
ncbi:MAG TPA: methyltransferase domain-containing protein [Anaerolineales bacterium]|nr:methyltransferase domain-containing protein [Anaerolineales bacterium]